MPEEQDVKCVLVGDGCVGKTCLATTYTMKEFPKDYVPTIFNNTSVLLQFKQYNINLSLWDTAGQEAYEELRPLCYPETSAFLVCFSVTDYTSYHNITYKWVPEIRERCSNTPIILVGTKVDLRDDSQVLKKLRENEKLPITSEEGEKLKDKVGAVKYMECSAKEYYNIDKVFEAVIEASLPNEPMLIPKKKHGLLSLFSSQSIIDKSTVEDDIVSHLYNS
jgi:small GTP-binding protein